MRQIQLRVLKHLLTGNPGQFGTLPPERSRWLCRVLKNKLIDPACSKAFNTGLPIPSELSSVHIAAQLLLLTMPTRKSQVAPANFR